MKFVKQNMVLVICGAVVLLAIASIFYPFGAWKSAWATDVSQTYKSRNNDIKSKQNFPLPLPGYPDLKGIPSDNITDAKKQVNAKMATQAAEIVKTSADANSGKRVVVVPVKDQKDVTETIPVLEGKQVPNLLPVIHRDKGVDPMDFKHDYEAIVPEWIKQVTGAATADAANPYALTTPPNPQDLSNDYQTQKNKIAAAHPMAQAAPTFMGGSDSNREQLDYERRAIMARAQSLQMYADQGAFQVRPWLAADTPPTEEDVFNALVDTWLQGDVVRAIIKTNGDTSNKDKNVGTAPVKRLLRITVGNDALVSRLGAIAGTTSGNPGGAVAASSGQSGASLFFLPSSAPAIPGAAPTPADQPPAGTTVQALPNDIQFTRSLTGRASGIDYDVVLMSINLDIDPGHLNQFIDQLYRQNMGYTVLNIRTQTVDPLERASYGFIYGEGQVIEAEIVVECLLFRNWTQPIMPDKVRLALGLPAYAPPAQPAQPAAQ
jgi:hypothetical protein